MNALTTLLHQRASLTQQIRAFFAERNVLEVNTPLLSQAAVTDPGIESFHVITGGHGRYLRTSPEFPLKRLLSAGAPDVFELGAVFRDGENGRLHNPEFNLLEWYRIGFEMQDLIDEVVALLRIAGDNTFSGESVQQRTYYDLFQRTFGVDVRQFEAEQLAELAAEHMAIPQGSMDVDQWLDLLFSSIIQPQLDKGIVVVTHYPASQAALAKLDPVAPDTALRFEVFVGGVELANGFEELNQSSEQAERFESDNRLREFREQKPMPIDTRFLESLDHMPACSGVALGFDRLLMLCFDLQSIDETLALPWALA
ncbi:MAG: EF-P lysine aminoacylase EpmA [Gammaproteobacteria bacterium]